MTDFTIHNAENSEGERAEVLQTAQSKYGFVPNLIGGLAEAPAAARAYMAIGAEVGKTSFTPTERHVAWFAVNYYNNCHYCMPAHTAVAKGEKIDDAVIETARNGGGYEDARLQALHSFMTLLVEHRGEIEDEDVEEFIEAGFTQQNVVEAILIITHKTLSNYANHVLKTPVDDAFKAFSWSK
ncbi:MAG: carboxymuconolactone decarboxylase family protein [Pseudomonadota bacterium]